MPCALDISAFQHVRIGWLLPHDRNDRCHGVGIPLAGADANHTLDGHDEDLAVAHLSRARRLDDGVDGGLDEAVD